MLILFEYLEANIFRIPYAVKEGGGIVYAPQGSGGGGQALPRSLHLLPRPTHAFCAAGATAVWFLYSIYARTRMYIHLLRSSQKSARKPQI